MAKLLSGTRIYGSATIDTTLSLGTSAIFTGSTSGTTTLLATAAAGTTTLTLPAATDTLVGRATTDTLTNKTLSSAILTGTLTAGGSVGTNGQILASTVTGVQWVDSGAAVDPVTTLTKSLTLTTNWQDTGISYTDLSTGTYLVQLYANDTGAGGSNSNEYYSGTMSWYAGATNSSVELPTDEIPLHRAGQSSEGGLYLRTFRSTSGSGANLKLQIYANMANSSASNYVFKFRKMI